MTSPEEVIILVPNVLESVKKNCLLVSTNCSFSTTFHSHLVPRCDRNYYSHNHPSRMWWNIQVIILYRTYQLPYCSCSMNLSFSWCSSRDNFFLPTSPLHPHSPLPSPLVALTMKQIPHYFTVSATYLFVANCGLTSPAFAAVIIEDISIPANYNFFNFVKPLSVRCDGLKGDAEAKVASLITSIIQSKAKGGDAGPDPLLTFPCDNGYEHILPITQVFQTTHAHLDYELRDEKKADDRQSNVMKSPAEGFVALFSLEDHNGAHFETEQTCVPIAKNRLILFEGGRVPHRTVIRNHDAEKNVMFIGPIEARSLLRVEIATVRKFPYHLRFFSVHCSYIIRALKFLLPNGLLRHLIRQANLANFRRSVPRPIRADCHRLSRQPNRANFHRYIPRAIQANCHRLSRQPNPANFHR